MSRHPTRFARSPLTEAVFEMRFAVVSGHDVELLPGVMLAALGRDFPRIEQMSLATLPKEMRDATPQLQHAAVFKLQGENEAVLLGDRVASFNATRPYPGWSTFRSRAIQVASALKESGPATTIPSASKEMAGEASSLSISTPLTARRCRVSYCPIHVI